MEFILVERVGENVLDQELAVHGMVLQGNKDGLLERRLMAYECSGGHGATEKVLAAVHLANYLSYLH